MSLAGRLETMWAVPERKGIDRELIIQNSLLTPAGCNVLSPGKTVTVDKSLELSASVSSYLKEKFL
jgi:hypothetical protein